MGSTMKINILLISLVCLSAFANAVPKPAPTDTAVQNGGQSSNGGGSVGDIGLSVKALVDLYSQLSATATASGYVNVTLIANIQAAIEFIAKLVASVDINVDLSALLSALVDLSGLLKVAINILKLTDSANVILQASITALVEVTVTMNVLINGYISALDNLDELDVDILLQIQVVIQVTLYECGNIVGILGVDDKGLLSVNINGLMIVTTSLGVGITESLKLLNQICLSAKVETKFIFTLMSYEEVLINIYAKIQAVANVSVGLGTESLIQLLISILPSITVATNDVKNMGSSVAGVSASIGVMIKLVLNAILTCTPNLKVLLQALLSLEVPIVANQVADLVVELDGLVNVTTNVVGQVGVNANTPAMLQAISLQ